MACLPIPVRKLCYSPVSRSPHRFRSERICENGRAPNPRPLESGDPVPSVELGLDRNSWHQSFVTHPLRTMLLSTGDFLGAFGGQTITFMSAKRQQLRPFLGFPRAKTKKSAGRQPRTVDSGLLNAALNQLNSPGSGLYYRIRRIYCQGITPALLKTKCSSSLQRNQGHSVSSVVKFQWYGCRGSTGWKSPSGASQAAPNGP